MSTTWRRTWPACASSSSARTRPVASTKDGLSQDELQTALRVLAAVAADRGVLAAIDREGREQLQRLCGEVARPDLKQRKKLQKALARAERQGTRDHDEGLRQRAGIQQLRAQPVFQAPLPSLPPATPPPALALHGGAPNAEALADEAPLAEAPRFSEERKCYVCKRPYLERHHFYDQLCPGCGELNFSRRTASADLRGRVALVTGARVKIGYQAALLLLRAGCTVVACTRFPRDAAQRYAREPDFSSWRERLQVYGVDLRHTPGVELLCAHLEQGLGRLDFQVHNACQTVRRPPGFYRHLLDRELQAIGEVPAAERSLLGGYEALRAAARAPGVAAPALLSQAASEADLLSRSALQAQAGLPAQGGALELFPHGVLDADLQQVDLRTHNSWRLALGEVPTLELLEVLLVNATAPFVMAQRLLPLMRRSAPPPGTHTSHDDARHVVMVSAMEGQFYRQHKTDKHPHTNMAKAALNMLVRTSAAALAR
ncbi:MAG: SDR family NAD(P)-dependent oxidoreductase, partial [Deltaproteobacteria bacterium]|nr:SDR family NAD(P)-dependent oxidoreductase [Deltaproteobacteria bacterium]